VRLKIELHTHTSDDPIDRIPHTTRELIDRAGSLGYQAVAITLHDKQLDVEPFRAYASTRNVVLIPGVERTIEGRHVLLLNFSRLAETVHTFTDLAALRQQERGLVVAPHPFFPLGSCVGRLLDVHPELFDAVEVNAMYAPGLDFNRRAIRWAQRHGKPLVGNADVHHLTQLGTTYSVVDAEPSPDSICEAIRAGHVELHTRPLSWPRAIANFSAVVGLWPVRTG
jgi:predicted metal-dependent phosphoesterase TrpH